MPARERGWVAIGQCASGQAVVAGIGRFVVAVHDEHRHSDRRRIFEALRRDESEFALDVAVGLRCLACLKPPATGTGAR
jgi:hypothetical protein